MKQWLRSIFLIVVALIMQLSASDVPKAVIIFDASGSMWGQINGKTKIEIARDALKNVVQEWNPNVELGLTVYGHRKKGDCNDIEAVIPVGKVNKKRVVDTVMQLQPKGKTPISRSLKKAAEELKYTEEKATIILISDGKETCDPDPCATAKALKAQGIDFVTHVIGFNVDKKTDEELACIAHATGGEYFSAKDAKALNKAIKTVAKKVEKPKPVTETTLLVAVRYDMEPRGKNVTGGKWFIMQEGKSIYEGSDISPRIKAKVGEVTISYVYEKSSIPQKIKQKITLKPQAKNSILLLVQSGKVIIDTAEKQGGPKVKSLLHIHPLLDESSEKGNNNAFATCLSTKSKACEKILPIGKYVVIADYNGMQTKKEFTLKDEEQKILHLYFTQTGNVEVTASEKEGGKWIAASCRAYNEALDDSWGVYPKKKEPGSVQIPVGEYRLKCTYNAFKAETTFEVKPGETTKVHVVFSPFFIGAKCTNSDTKVTYEIYGSDGRLVYDTKAPCSETVKVILNDGKYSIEAAIDGAKSEAQFVVGSGHPHKLTLDLTNLNHEEEIKADSLQETVVVPVQPKKQEVSSTKKSEETGTISLGRKKLEIKGLSKEEANELKELGNMLNALGGMVQGSNGKGGVNTQDAASDEEFDEMSKDLEMFTK